MLTVTVLRSAGLWKEGWDNYQTQNSVYRHRQWLDWFKLSVVVWYFVCGKEKVSEMAVLWKVASQYSRYNINYVHPIILTNRGELTEASKCWLTKAKLCWNFISCTQVSGYITESRDLSFLNGFFSWRFFLEIFLIFFSFAFLSSPNTKSNFFYLLKNLQLPLDGLLREANTCRQSNSFFFLKIWFFKTSLCYVMLKTVLQVLTLLLAAQLFG